MEFWAGVMFLGFLVSGDFLKVFSKEYWGLCVFFRGEVYYVY